MNSRTLQDDLSYFDSGCIQLEPINPSPEAPRDKDGTPLVAFYGPSHWATLLFYLGLNNAKLPDPRRKPIDESHCALIADALSNDEAGLLAYCRGTLSQQILTWRTCGGFLQQIHRAGAKMMSRRTTTGDRQRKRRAERRTRMRDGKRQIRRDRSLKLHGEVLRNTQLLHDGSSKPTASAALAGERIQ